MFRHTTPTENEQMDGTFLQCVEHTYWLSVRFSDTGVAMELTPNTVNACTRSSLGKRNIQRRYSAFVEQPAQRRHKNFTIEEAVEAKEVVIMSLPGGGDGQR